MRTKDATTLLLLLAALGSAANERVWAGPPPRLVLPVLALQTAPPPTARVNESFTDVQTGRLYAGAVLGGLSGLAVGGAAGFAAAGCDQSDEDFGLCLIPWIGGGGAIGGAIGVPLGVHLANHRQGRVMPAIAASLGIAALGIVATAGADNEGAGVVILGAAVPLAQIISAVEIERATARARRRQHHDGP